MPLTSSSPSPALQEALALHRQGQIGAAMERYMRILRDDPRDPDALFYVAVVVLQDGQLEEGVKLTQRALSLGPPPGPPQARLHNLLGQAQFRLKQYEAALQNFDRAIAAQPDLAAAHGNRASLLAELGRLSEAMVGFDNALLLRPDSVEDWINRGTTLQWLDRIEEALKSHERALALRPDMAGAHFNRGNVLRDLAQMEDARGLPSAARFDEAEAAQTRAIELQPGFADAHLGRALTRLVRGNWAAGFADYEHRERAGSQPIAPLSHPRWQGEPLTDARLVLVAEQGLGDLINLCRFAPLLAARGFDVTMLVQPVMRALLSTLPRVTIVTSTEELANDKRPIRWLPLMSLPGVLGITPDNIPATVPYLAAEPARIASWAQRLGTDGFKIGINWVGAPRDNPHFNRRNIPLAAFAPLAALPGVRLFSLQKGPATAQIAQVPFRDRIITLATDPDPSRDFFLDTAAVMMNLDLIVSNDTAVAHLAGALARPTCLPLPAVVDWRWLLGRDDTPWYPTVRLFRQRAPGDWGEVMARIAEAARAMIGAR